MKSRIEISTPLQDAKSFKNALAIFKTFEGTLLHCWWDWKLVQSLWRTILRFLRKLKIELPHDPAVPLLGIYQAKTTIQKSTRTPVFIAVLLAIAKTWKQRPCPFTDEWVKKMWSMYTMEYPSAMKKIFHLFYIHSSMDGPRDYHAKLWYHLHVESEKNNINELIYKTEIGSQT